MEKSTFESIMNDEDIIGIKILEPGCNALKGLIIINKYLPDSGVTGACYGNIYSVRANRLLVTDITEEDVKELRMQNWRIDDGFLACLV